MLKFSLCFRALIRKNAFTKFRVKTKNVVLESSRSLDERINEQQNYITKNVFQNSKMCEHTWEHRHRIQFNKFFETTKMGVFCYWYKVAGNQFKSNKYCF